MSEQPDDLIVTDPAASRSEWQQLLGRLRGPARLDRIRADIIAGRYRADADAIAASLIERLLTDSRIR